MTNRPDGSATPRRHTHGRGQVPPPPARFSRRRLIKGGLVVGAALTGGGTKLWRAPTSVQAQSVPQPSGSPLPISGQPVPPLAAFDEVMQQVMARWGLQGGALALAKDGRLVFSRAYGW